jgi:hypothetical protein
MPPESTQVVFGAVPNAVLSLLGSPQMLSSALEVAVELLVEAGGVVVAAGSAWGAPFGMRKMIRAAAMIARTSAAEMMKLGRVKGFCSVFSWFSLMLNLRWG